MRNAGCEDQGSGIRDKGFLLFFPPSALRAAAAELKTNASVATASINVHTADGLVTIGIQRVSRR
jgi:hypothetical protein